jgi:anhydro-N-acetylmuramic acid kinase
MSGTSLDGIDAVLVDLSGLQPKLLGTHFQSYPDTLRNSLLAIHFPGHDELHRSQMLANELAQGYASTVASLLKSTSTSESKVRAIGCHGQTIRHRPEQGYTIQLNNAPLLVELCGIPVVADFRSRDIAAGGQGAPLVPAFHDRILRHHSIHRVIVNIGGISNLTDLPPNGATTGFDCGPGNLLMDAWIYEHHRVKYDQDGSWATMGRVIPGLLQRLLQEPFLLATPPKSSGRDLFNLVWLKNHLHGGESPEDVQATLLAFTAHTIADAIKRFCHGAQEVYFCGGGARNHALVSAISIELPDHRIDRTDILGIGADWMEAIAFAWLAQQTVHGCSANLPEVTGARHHCVLGAIYPA